MLRETVVSMSPSEQSKRTTAILEEDYWMDHDSDDEPIATRKRPGGYPSRSPTSSAVDGKRMKQEEREDTDTDAKGVNIMPSLVQKLEQWTPQLTKELTEFTTGIDTEPPACLYITDEKLVALKAVAGSGNVLVTGLEGEGRGSDASAVHNAEKFPFLLPDRIQDAEGRRPGEMGYDPTTLRIPPTWFQEQKISAGQRQWWMFKASNFDSLLLFKVGKFYELYEMDAHVAVEVLGLKYMKGERPHCGFPESGYAEMAAGLAGQGYKVVVIEQTETPEQLKERNEILKSTGKSAAKVVAREKVAVITKGTLRDADMIADASDASYLMSICGKVDANGTVCFGFSAVDVATSQFMLSQFKDNDLFSRLRTQIAMLGPVEFILPQPEEELFQGLYKMVDQCAPSARVNGMAMGALGFAGPDVSAALLGTYFASEHDVDRPSLPSCLAKILEKVDDYAPLLSSCAAVIRFLKQGMLDEAIIPISSFHIDCMEESSSPVQYEEPEHVFLDGSAIENLEIFTDSDGKVSGSLLASLDHCVTPFGKRLLKKWIGKPLVRLEEIRDRQDAVQDLLTVGAAAAGKVRRRLAAVGDLERLLIRLHSSSLKGAHAGRDADYVILYEDVTKKKVISLVTALDGLRTINESIGLFNAVADQFTSSLLRSLVTTGMQFPSMTEALHALSSAANWSEAKQTGRVIPSPGVVSEYDTAKAEATNVERQLEEYLNGLRSALGVRSEAEVSYSPIKKEKYVIEVSERLVMKIPGDFELVSQKKGFKRFTCLRLKELVRELETAEEKCDRILGRVLRELIAKFVWHHETWSSAVQAMAQLDVLMSLTVASVSIPGPSSRPVLIPYSENSVSVFKAAQLRHPNLHVERAFVPNDVQLGDNKPNFMVLTGANMGGKSTLLRQVCLATIMAQVGAFVPAASLELTPVDSVFVRMGAKDRIVCGQSTFFVELSETAAMLRNATSRSLVALDELGRGTATTDGEAIAHAVLDHLSSRVRCRGIFATHYHSLAREFGHNSNVSVKHMACQLTKSEETDGRLVDVKFLYKLAEGVAPKSYGMNVARLAGLSHDIVQRANDISEQMEEIFQRKCAK